MAVRSGWTAAVNAWRGDIADTIQTRRARYDVLWGFYLNDIYDEAVNDMAKVYKKQRELYAAIEPLYNPVGRLVDFYVAKVGGGTLDPTGEAGALPITDADPDVVAAIVQVWKWSNWGLRKGLWVRYGAALGDSVLKVVEDQAGEVAIQVHWPGDLVDADFDHRGRLTYAVFEYTAQERNAEGEIVKYTYREEITPEAFATYRDGKAFDYGNGEEWSNPYGFVPVVVTRHKESGQSWGLCCFHNSIPKVDDLNDLASHLGDQIRKAIHPQWVSFGTSASSGNKLERSDKIWHHPMTDGRVEALVEEIDVAACTGEIASRLREIEQDCPELKVYHMAGQELSGRAVRLLLGDVIDRVTEARGQYDAALVEADKMALRIGALRGYWGGSLTDEFEHSIGDREIFPTDESESLDLAGQRLNLEMQQAMQQASMTGS